MKKIVLFCISTLLFIINAHAELPLGKIPPSVILPGGKTDGSAWKSEEISGKVYVLFYVDPDEKEINQHVTEALTKEKYPRDQFGIIAVMNLGATWLPNFVIESMLKSKQNKIANTIYVKDRTKELVKKWTLKDDSFDVIAFDKRGRVIFSQDGKLSKEDLETLNKEVKKYLE